MFYVKNQDFYIEKQRKCGLMPEAPGASFVAGTRKTLQIVNIFALAFSSLLR
jgi:hypothetical protein